MVRVLLTIRPENSTCPSKWPTLLAGCRGGWALFIPNPAKHPPSTLSECPCGSDLTVFQTTEKALDSDPFYWYKMYHDKLYSTW